MAQKELPLSDKPLRNRGAQLAAMRDLAARIPAKRFVAKDGYPVAKSTLLLVMGMFDSLCSDTGAANDRPWNWITQEERAKIISKNVQTLDRAMSVLKSMDLLTINDCQAFGKTRRLKVRINWSRVFDQEISQDEENLRVWSANQKRQRKLFGKPPKQPAHSRKMSEPHSHIFQEPIPTFLGNAPICDPQTSSDQSSAGGEGVSGGEMSEDQEADDATRRFDGYAVRESTSSENGQILRDWTASGNLRRDQADTSRSMDDSAVATLPDRTVPGSVRDFHTNARRHEVESMAKRASSDASSIDPCTTAGLVQSTAAASFVPSSLRVSHSGRQTEEHHDDARTCQTFASFGDQRTERSEVCGHSSEGFKPNGINRLGSRGKEITLRCSYRTGTETTKDNGPRIKDQPRMPTRTISPVEKNPYFRAVLELYGLQDALGCLRKAADLAGHTLESLQPRIDFLASRLIWTGSTGIFGGTGWSVPFIAGQVYNCLSDSDRVSGEVHLGYGPEQATWRSYANDQPTRRVGQDLLPKAMQDEYERLAAIGKLPALWSEEDARAHWKPKPGDPPCRKTTNPPEKTPRSASQTSAPKTTTPPVPRSVPNAKEPENTDAGCATAKDGSADKLEQLLATPEGRRQLLALLADSPGGKSPLIRQQVESGQLKTSGRMACLAVLGDT